MKSAYRHKKHLGQHFLSDPQVLAHIVRAIQPNTTHPILEIGPGLGALTTALLPHCHRITVIEKDTDVIQPLKTTCDTLGECTVLHMDVLDANWKAILLQPTRIVGNLPYQISSPLLFQLFDHLDPIIDMHFMLQQEVAHRMTATPRQKAYGRLSVMTQYHCEAHLCLDVPPEAFTPPPRVHSSFIRLTPHPHKQDAPYLSHWVTLAFQQRRKKMRNSLQAHLNPGQHDALTPWADARPESLSVQDFVELSQSLGAPMI